MVILPSGGVGIGTGVDGTGLPIVTDKLQVLATSGSERRHQRLRQAVRRRGTRGHMLLRSPLQERHHAIRARAQSAHRAAAGALLLARRGIPYRHFGDAQAYGLIAQDVEQVLPELVVTGADGYKAVDYTSCHCSPFRPSRN